MASVINLLVTARDGTAAGLRAARRSMQRFEGQVREGWRNIGRTAGQALGDAMSNGLGNGLRTAMSNPYVATAVAGLGVAVGALLGAAIAGALVLAIGGAFVGLGVFLAFQAKGVKEKWKGTLDELKPLFIDAASGMLPVIEHARKQFEGIAKAFAPHFKAALDKAAPHVTTFMDHIINGFKKLGQKAAGPLEEAFNVMLSAFGPHAEELLSEIGDSLAGLAQTVTDHSTEIALALRLVFSLISVLIDIVTFFAETWAEVIRGAAMVIGQLVGAVAVAVDAILGMLAALISGAEKVARAVGMDGVADKLATAKDAFGRLREQVVGDMQTMSQRFKGVGAELDRMNAERKLKVNIKSWENQIQIAKAKLNSVPKEKQAKLKAEISQLKQKVAQAQAAINNLHGKSLPISVYLAASSSDKDANGVPDMIQARATGGIMGAATGGVRSNFTMVGEQGPELVRLPAGSSVRSNSDSRRIGMGMGGGGTGSPMVINLSIAGRELGQILIDTARQEVATRGGNVQAVLGKRGA